MKTPEERLMQAMALAKSGVPVHEAVQATIKELRADIAELSPEEVAARVAVLDARPRLPGAAVSGRRAHKAWKEKKK